MERTRQKSMIWNLLNMDRTERDQKHEEPDFDFEQDEEKRITRDEPGLHL